MSERNYREELLAERQRKGMEQATRRETKRIEQNIFGARPASWCIDCEAGGGEGASRERWRGSPG
jgi:hypothetical protein